ncbi:MAG: GGDEF domain-containing protein [Candidatus Fimenecus sp.]
MRLYEKVLSFFDTNSEKAILTECKENETQLKHDFAIDTAVRNRMKAVRFWLWIALITESVRCGVAAVSFHRVTGEIPTSARIFAGLYVFMFVLNVLCLVGGLLVRRNPEKHYRLITVCCNLYMLLYMLRSVVFTVLDLETGFIGFSLIVALFVSAATLYYRPVVLITNVFVTITAFFIAVFCMDLQVFLEALLLFRIMIVALLSIVIGISRYRSKYKVFLKEYSLLQKSEALNRLNTELQDNRVQIEAKNRQLQKLTNTDDLTGLRSRRSFVRESAETLARAAEKGCFVTMAIADIDNFKLINDTYGHTVGDACLRAVGEALAAVEAEDGVHAYRLGGDELMVVFEDKSRSDAFLAMNRVAKAVSNLQIPRCGQPITLSVGIHSAVPTAQSHIDEYIEKADMLLYAAKANGRNQIVTTIKDKGEAKYDAD